MLYKYATFAKSYTNAFFLHVAYFIEMRKTTFCTVLLLIFCWNFPLFSQSLDGCKLTDLKKEIRQLQLQAVKNINLVKQDIETCCKSDSTAIVCIFGEILLAKKEGNLKVANQLLEKYQKNAVAEWWPFFLAEQINLLLVSGKFDQLSALSDSLNSLPEPVVPINLQALIAGHQGIMFQYQGKYPEALAKFISAKKKYQSIDDSLGIVQTLHNIGNIRAITKGYVEAQLIFEQTIKDFNNLGIPKLQGIAAHNLGNLFVVQEKDSLALPHYQKALQIYQGQNDAIGLGQANNAIGLVFKRLDEPDSAMVYLEKSLFYREKSQDTRGKAYTFLNLGRVFYQKNNLAESKRYIYKSWAIADSLHLLDIHKDVFELLTTIAESEGESALALKYKNQQVAMQDSMLGTEKIRKVIAMEKENQISEMRTDDKNNHWLIGGSLISLVVLLTALFMIYKKVKDNEPPQTNPQLNKAKRELAAVQMSQASDSAFFEELLNHIEQLNQEKKNNALQKLKRSIEHHNQFRDDWPQTIRYFKEVYPQFFQHLQQRHPTLTTNDLRHATFVRMGLSAKETSQILKVKYTTVEVARYRLKKKMDLKKGEKLSTYLIDFQ